MKKKCFLSGIARITSPPLPPIWTTCTTFLDIKNDVSARITEPSNDDYDNDVSDNCDHDFVLLLMILVLKITNKYHIT